MDRDRTPRSRRWTPAALLMSCALIAACGSDDSSETADGSSAATSSPDPTTTAAAAGTGATSAVPDGPAAGGRCVVRLHGKGDDGAETSTEADVTMLAPAGNAEGWDGRQWLYFPDDRYDEARSVVAAAADGCEQIIVGGFSNGAAFAAKLYCRGETFDGRLVGVVVDDPVVDAGVEGCAPEPDVAVTLYWTGALEDTAEPGWSCEEADWTCEGGSTIGIEAYATELGTEVVESPFDDHQWFLDAPELDDWP